MCVLERTEVAAWLVLNLRAGVSVFIMGAGGASCQQEKDKGQRHLDVPKKAGVLYMLVCCVWWIGIEMSRC